MNASEVMRMAMKHSHTSYRDMEELMEYRGHGTVARMLNRQNPNGMRVETLIRWLEVLGAQLVVSIPEDDAEYVLDGEEELGDGEEEN